MHQPSAALILNRSSTLVSLVLVPNSCCLCFRNDSLPITGCRAVEKKPTAVLAFDSSAVPQSVARMDFVSSVIARQSAAKIQIHPS